MPSERTIVIGAGVGGLVSAALLAARGHDVTVLEAAATPGGKLRAMKVDGTAIDGGPTVFTMADLFRNIFDQCGDSLDSHLNIRPADVLARHSWKDDRLDLFADPAASEDAIATFAGMEEARGYRAFRAESKRLFDALDRPFLRDTKTNPLTLGWRMGLAGFRDYLTLRPYTSMSRALGHYFRDPRLQQLFGRYATYCGSSPFQCPATLMLIAHVEAQGVGLIDGGMYQLAIALEALGRRNGVTFQYDSPVSDIVVDRGDAVGVTTANGEHLRANSIICNADPAALADGRFGQTASRAVSRIAPRRRSLGALVWTGHAQTSGADLSHHNIVFSSDYPAEFAALRAGRLATDPTVYICAPPTSGDNPTRPLQILVNAPPTGDTHAFTPAEIDQCTNTMLDSVSRAGLLFRLGPSSILTTPREFEAMNPSTGGALYGPASHGWAASFLRQGSRTRIPGLYCAGGSTHPGAGVPMAALSGQLAVDCLLRDRASMSRSMPVAMPGGISTPQARTAATG